MIAAAGTVSVAICIEDASWADAVPGIEMLAESAVRRALAAGCPALDQGEVSVLLADDTAVRALNARWRGRDAPTNVLSFPATEAAPGVPATAEFRGVPLMIGDIALARETIAREAREQDKPIADHLVHLVVHGTLHLLGYDHEEEAMAVRMEQLETEVLAQLGIRDPYAAESATP